MTQVSRYHPLLVTLHWMIALLIFGALILGFFGLALTPDSSPHKIDRLEVHMASGMLILLLMGVRFIVRIRTAKPGKVPTGYRLFDRVAPITHYAFYVLVPLMVGTGYATAILAGLPAIVFARSGAPLPSSFMAYPTFVAHSSIAVMLVCFIALHVAAALYHQFVKQDRLFRRMFFGRRTELLSSRLGDSRSPEV